MKPNSICSIVILICSFSSTLGAKSHPITTLINAKWSVTPIQLEIAEYLSDSSNQKFWQFIDELANLKVSLDELESDYQRYKASIDVASKLLTQAQVKLLKLSLSLRSLTPRIQSNFMIADDVLKHGDCDDSSTAFVIIGGELVCTVSELREKLKKPRTGQSSNSELYSFDHIYPGTDHNTVITTLYGGAGANQYNEFHRVLKQEAINGKIKYVTRHFIRHRSQTKVRLSGYGVELHLKSTEYKAQDDSVRKDTDETIVGDSDENEIEGFDFAALKDRLPHLSHSLDRLRGSLMEKNEEIAPLKAWEFQELGLQAAERVASIQGEEALSILQFTAQNFPTQAKTLVHTKVSDDFKAEMKNNIDVFARNLNLQPPDAALFLNGMYFDAESLDVETLLDTLKSESAALDGLNRIGLRGSASGPLLALDFASQAKEFAIDIRDSAVVWTNDLEVDKEYRRWGGSVMDMLRPTFPGMMRSVRKNFFNLVLIFDPVKPEARDLVRMAEGFVTNMAPLRLGVVFDTKAGTGELNELYRSINCAFNYMHQKTGAREALSFLLDIFATTEKTDDVTLDTIRKVFKKTNAKLSSDDIDDVLGDDSDFDYGRQLSEEFIERLGVKKIPQGLLNGVLLTEKSLNRDDFEELILTEIMQQTPNLQKSIYKGELSDGESVIDFLMQQPHVMLR
jgi:UDP-glucose:glycoprotein glucosyltransferase